MPLSVLSGVFLQAGLHIGEILHFAIVMTFGVGLLVVVTPVKLGVVWVYTRKLEFPVRRSHLRWTSFVLTLLSVPLYVGLFVVRGGVLRDSEPNFALGLGARRCAVVSALASGPVLLAAIVTWLVLKSFDL